MSNSDSENIRVLAAVVAQNGRYLVYRRPSHKRHGGLWEFPGGKLERGESLLEAAKRELAEELDVAVTSTSDPVFTVTDAGSVFVIEFVPTSIEGSPACIEHIELSWAPLEELIHFELAPSDRRFVEFMLHAEAPVGAPEALAPQRREQGLRLVNGYQ